MSLNLKPSCCEQNGAALDVKHPPFTTDYLRTLHDIRRAELELAIPSIPSGAHILEFGGARGYQASVLAQHGFRVTSIDILESRPEISFFPVQQYDGVNFPFADGSFDVVFSSGAITQVPYGEPLQHIIQEMARVMRKGGCQVHIIPTPYWRIWTSLAHPFFTGLRGAIRLLQRQIAAIPQPSLPPNNVSAPESKSNLSQKLWYGIFSKPVTAARSVPAEWWELHEHVWRQNFEKAGLTVLETRSAQHFYTGHLFFNRLPLWFRRALSRVLGASCRIYVVKRRAD